MPKPEGYKFKISGEEFKADVPLDTYLDMRHAVNLSYTEEGDYALTLEILRPDGVALIHERIEWTYSRVGPAVPQVTFTEKATSDDLVTFVFSADLSSNINEVWIAGDTAENNDGGWYSIPDNFQLPVVVSEEDGLKNFTLKFRNVFGNEGEEFTASILKKSIGPKDCVIEVPGAKTNSRDFSVYLSAVNEGAMYYHLSGDVEALPVQEFFGSTYARIKLAKGKGTKKFRLKMNDLAENACPEKEFTVVYDKNYIPAGVDVADHLLWTDSLDITLEQRFDFPKSTEAQMFISGSIYKTANTFKWIPFQEAIAVKLEPVEGHRNIHVVFRNAFGEVSSRVSTGIYLKPFIRISGSLPRYSIAVSHFATLLDLTLTGCSENYNHVAYREFFLCTPTGRQATVVFYLIDGTLVTRKAAF